MSAIEHRTAPAEPAQADWFSMACKILAPGTTHYSTTAVALTWDDFDRLEAHGWEYRAWVVDPATDKRVEEGMPGRLHEQRDRKLSDGSTASCYPPPLVERPALMLCPTCMGRGWTLVTDHENGDAAQMDCEACDQSGRVSRPFSSSAQLLADLGVPS